MSLIPHTIELSYLYAFNGYHAFAFSMGMLGAGLLIGLGWVLRSLQRLKPKAEKETARSLIDSLEQIIWCFDSQGELSFHNRFWREYSGLVELEGWKQAVHPDDLPKKLAHLKEARRTGNGYDLEVRYRRASDGTFRWHHVRVEPIADEREGKIHLWLGSAVDIQERKESLEAFRAGEQRLLLAQEVGRMGTWEWDVAGDRVQWSPLTETIHGLEPGHFAGNFESYWQCIHESDHSRVNAALACCVHVDSEFQVEYQISSKADHPTRWVESHGRIVADGSGQPTRMIGVCRDVTERKQSESKLRNALELAENAGRAKDQFLAMLSHELRTPLTPVVLAAGEILSDSTIDPRHRESIQMIRQHVDLEIRLIDDLLDVMRIVRGKMSYRFQDVDAHPLIVKTLQICEGEAQEKKVSLAYEQVATESNVKADPARLQQILWNLIKNALKFTPEGGGVLVRSLPVDGFERIILEVSDTGVGITPQTLPNIFNAFEQAENPSAGRFGGLGLGLAISRSIAEAHGGTLTAFSEGEGQGAVFTLELPTVSVEVSQSSAADEPKKEFASEAAGIRLLLVEDDPMTARVMARLLRRNGYEVRSAGSVATALAAPFDEIDLLVSDIGLPDGNGFELMTAVKAKHDIPGIAISGYGRDDDIQKSRASGFVAHMTKPVDFTQLDLMIRKVIANPAVWDASGSIASR